MPNILLVEDEDHLAIGIRYNLTSEGLTVTTAADGHEALAILNEPNTDIDLVVLDVMLPGMSGYAVCEQIRSQWQPYSGCHAHCSNLSRRPHSGI